MDINVLLLPTSTSNDDQNQHHKQNDATSNDDTDDNGNIIAPRGRLQIYKIIMIIKMIPVILRIRRTRIVVLSRSISSSSTFRCVIVEVHNQRKDNLSKTCI
jgi:hypothetical protein